MRYFVILALAAAACDAPPEAEPASVGGAKEDRISREGWSGAPSPAPKPKPPVGMGTCLCTGWLAITYENDCKDRPRARKYPYYSEQECELRQSSDGWACRAEYDIWVNIGASCPVRDHDFCTQRCEAALTANPYLNHCVTGMSLDECTLKSIDRNVDGFCRGH